jgi:hypothetical protein
VKRQSDDDFAQAFRLVSDGAHRHSRRARGRKHEGAEIMSDGQLVFYLLILSYLLPAIVAAVRRHHNQNAIFILNVLLGWTFVGWVVALVWAATYVEPRNPYRRIGVDPQ